MKVCWKRALDIMNRYDCLDSVTDTCYICDCPLRYSDDVKVKTFYEDSGPTLAIVHLLCAALDVRTALQEH